MSSVSNFTLFIVFAASLFLTSSATAQEEAEQRLLSQKYMSIHGSALKASFTPQADPKEVALAVATAFLRSQQKGSNWNPDHPEWKRISAQIQEDVPSSSIHKYIYK